MLYILALFAVVARGQTLLDEVFQIPAGEWRYMTVLLKQVPVTVECDSRVISGNGAIGIALVNREGLDDLKQGERLGSGALQRQGTFSRVVSVADEYAVVLDNRGPGAATVRLRVSLDFSERGRPQARYLPPEKRFVVIVISASVFLGIVLYSGRKLLGVMRT
jgi:hypothetical protein